MDFLKKAKSQVKGAMQEAQGMYGQYKSQQQQQNAQHPQQNHYAGQHQVQSGYQQPQSPYQGSQHSQPAYQGYHQAPPTQYHPQQQYSIPPPTQPQYQQYVQQQQPLYQTQPVRQPASQQHQQHQQHQPAQSTYSSPQGQQQPPSNGSYDMSALQQNLPGVPPQVTQPSAPQPPIHSPAVSAISYSTPPAATPVASSPALCKQPQSVQSTVVPIHTSQRPGQPVRRPCPRFESVPVDVVQFYVFTSSVLAREPAIQEDSFGICEACFVNHIVPHTSIAGCFEPRKADEAVSGHSCSSYTEWCCDFALPTALQTFYQGCVQRGTIDPLLQFVKLMISLPGCDGSSQLEASQGYASRERDGFVVCKSCFEKYLRRSPFESSMVIGTLVAGWNCDVGSRGYAFRALMAELDDPQPDARRFSTKLKQRNSLPPCPGPGNPIAPADSAGPHYTYEAIDEKAGVLCQACYWDKVLGTSMEPFFNSYTKLDRQYYGDVKCDLAKLQETYAMEVAIRAGDDEVWRRCAIGRALLPACTGIDGIDEETLQGQDASMNQWHCFTDYPSIEICSFCYCANIELLGAGNLFSPITRPLKAGVVRMCFLAEAQNLGADTSDHKNFENTLVWRGTMLRNWLFRGYSVGIADPRKHDDFSGLRDVAQTISSWPPPCASNKRAVKPSSGRKWYGNHFLAEGDNNKVGIAVCQECFVHCVKDTPLEWFAGVDLTEKTTAKYPEGFVCNTWTRRARDELHAACKNGDFLQFARYWAARLDVERRRKEIDDRCQQQVAAQKQMLATVNLQGQQMQVGLMQQLTANTNATIMGIGGSVSEAAATDYGQRYGNSAVGYGYLTQGGAAAAQAHADAAKMGQQGVSLANHFHATGDTWTDTQRLLALGKAIEAEWEAIQ